MYRFNLTICFCTIVTWCLKMWLNLEKFSLHNNRKPVFVGNSDQLFIFWGFLSFFINICSGLQVNEKKYFKGFLINEIFRVTF